jgi:hypothetical protein
VTQTVGCDLTGYGIDGAFPLLQTLAQVGSSH